VFRQTLCHANFGVEDYRHFYFGRAGVRKGSAMVRLDRVLVSSYRLLKVTMPPTGTVWLHFVMHVCGVQTVGLPSFGGMGIVVGGSESVPQGSCLKMPFARSCSAE